MLPRLKLKPTEAIEFVESTLQEDLEYIDKIRKLVAKYDAQRKLFEDFGGTMGLAAKRDGCQKCYRRRSSPR